jgi:RNase adaptor protein for sRNA GlmZ degradation
MGSKQSTVENNCVEELNNINEEDLDISRIDKLQIKAIKEMNNKIKKLNKEKTIVSFTNYQFKFVITVCFDLVILY